MSRSEPSFNGDNRSSPLQRILVAAGTLVVIALTVIIAVLLAVQPAPPGVTVTPAVTATAVVIGPSLTFTPLPPTLTPTQSPTPLPPTLAQATPVPTDTPVPLPPTDTPTSPPPPSTPTPIVVVVTPTPLPTSSTASVATPGVCQPPADWFTYVVQSGDTLNTLAARTGVSVFDLQQVNCLPNFTLQPGQIVYLPFEPPTPTATGTSTPVTPSATPSSTPTQTATPRPPEIFEITISIARDKITIRGRNFEPDPGQGFRVELTGLTGTLPPLEFGDLRSGTGFEVLIPATVPAGDYDLRVINPDNQFVQRRITLPAPP